VEDLSGSEALSSLALELRALLMKPTRRRSFPGSGSQPGTNGWGGENSCACSVAEIDPADAADHRGGIMIEQSRCGFQKTIRSFGSFGASFPPSLEAFLEFE